MLKCWEERNCPTCRHRRRQQYQGHIWCTKFGIVIRVPTKTELERRRNHHEPDSGDRLQGRGGKDSAAEGSGAQSRSKTERAAISVVRAEKRLETARMWESVFLRMDKIFPENSTEGYVAGMVYGNGISQAELARISGCSRQTIKLRQDRYVIRLALLAAQAGLIKREAMTDNGKADQAERGIETY